MNNQELIKLVNSKWVHQIRAGEKHRFVDITIVETEGRFFVRQYKFGKKSWYDAFLKDSNGAIKINNTVVSVDGIVPENMKETNRKVNKAYFRKMNVFYWLMQLTYDRKKHEASTLELIPKLKK
jgi:hypothetical protein